MRKLLIVVIVLVVLLVAADVFARSVAEDQIARRLQRTFDLANEPSVSVEGMPFLLNLVRGEISGVKMTGDRVRSEDVTLEDVQVDIDEVRFSVSDVIDGSGEVRATDGSGSATVSEASLNAALERSGAPVSLDLAEAGDQLALEENAIAVAAQGAPPIALDLPSLGGSVQYDDLTVENDHVLLSFSVEDLEVST
jgi:hypothetical protein